MSAPANTSTTAAAAAAASRSSSRRRSGGNSNSTRSTVDARAVLSAALSNSNNRNNNNSMSSAVADSAPAPATMATSTSTTNNNDNNVDIVMNDSSNNGNNNYHRFRKPGAYVVVSESQGDPNFFHLLVPNDVVPGNVFDFTISSTLSNGRVGQRTLSVRCPPEARPGHDTLQISVLQEPRTIYRALKMAPITSSSMISTSSNNKNNINGGGGSAPMKSVVMKRNEDAIEESAEVLLVTIPENVEPGGKFIARRRDGSKFLVTSPKDGRPGQTLRIILSSAEEEKEEENWNRINTSERNIQKDETSLSKLGNIKRERAQDSIRRASVRYKFFEVVVPDGAQPNQILPVNVLGKRVPLQLPDKVVGGETIKLKLPIDEVVDNVELDWDKFYPGWNRTIRRSDFKFKWVKTSTTETAETTTTTTNLDVFKELAFVRHLTFLEGNDERMRTGTVTLIPAQDAVVESELTIGGFKTLVSYADIAHYQTQPLDVKTEWFQQICSGLSPPWDAGRIQIVVRRQHLLADAVKAVMSLRRSDMRRKWRIDFQNEPAIDAGGVTREFFELVTEQLFDPDFGLWLSSANNQICMRINPACHVSCPEDHLIYFRFLGRMMGRALFDRQLIKGHMVRYLYSHLLGWPVTFDDLESQDEEYYQSLKQIASLDDLSSLCLDFTITEETLGERRTIELIPNGSDQEVNEKNRLQYLEAILQYRMLHRNKLQIQELLIGFFDVVPEPALSVFDPSELELLLCGLPTLDMEDWRRNTILSGNFAENMTTIEWFWDIIRNRFDQEMKARFLQFVTGTSGVPLGGFAVLQGQGGEIKLFTIHIVDHTTQPYPRSHTCFNRIDLPDIKSKEEMYEKLKLAIAVAGIGFGIE